MFIVIISGWAELAEEQVDCVWEQEPAAGAGEEWSHGDHQHDQLCQDWTRWHTSVQSEQIELRLVVKIQVQSIRFIIKELIRINSNTHYWIDSFVMYSVQKESILKNHAMK